MKLKKSPASANTLKGGGSVLPPGNEALMLREDEDLRPEMEPGPDPQMLFSGLDRSPG